MKVQVLNAKGLLRKVRPIIFDIAQEMNEMHTEQFGPLTCKKGCAWCCYQKQLANYFEGAMIAAYLEDSGQWTPELENKLRWADKTMTEYTHTYLALNTDKVLHACAFLDETEPGKGTCTVYPVRPLSCAVTVSTHDDPKKCFTEGGPVITTTTTTQLQLLEIKSAAQAGESDRQLMTFTLPGAVLYARAKLKGLPLPDVRMIPMIPIILEHGNNEKAIRDAFDAVAKYRMPDEPLPQGT